MAENNKGDDKENYLHIVASEMEVSIDNFSQKSFDDMFGVEKTINMLKERVVFPFRFPQLFQNKRLQNQISVMLFGAPGSGKSYLLSAAANASNAKLFVFNLWNLQNRRLMTESVETLMETVFQVARQNAPSILCFEDLEVLSRPSEHFTKGKMALLTEILRIDKNSNYNKVAFVGVTQRPWDVNLRVLREFLRPRGSYVVLPNEEARSNILKVQCNKLSHSLQPEDFQSLASKTDGFSGSELFVLVRDASMQQIRKLGKATHFKKVFMKALHESKSNTMNEQNNKQDPQSTSPLDQASKEDNAPESQSCEHAKEAVAHKISCKISHGVQGGNESGSEERRETGDQISNSSEQTIEKKQDILSENVCFESCDYLDEKTINELQELSLNLTVIDSECHQKPFTEKTNENLKDKFIPCNAGDSGAISMSVFDIPEENLYVAPLTIEDMEEVLKNTRSAINEEEVQKLSQFESEFCAM